jgi:hypothetical protein
MSDADFSRIAKRRSAVAIATAGVVTLAVGALLFYLGITYVEPAERIATRAVGGTAPIVLSIAGGLVALFGIVLVVVGLRSGRRGT